VAALGAEAGAPGTGEPGSCTNWFTDAATLLDSAGAVGLWAKAWAAAISSCVACPGLLAACWIIGLSSDNAGSPGSCWVAFGCGVGCGAAGSAAALGQTPNAAADAVTTAAKPFDRFQVLATVSSGRR
jgi:hypothetical protein